MIKNKLSTQSNKYLYRFQGNNFTRIFRDKLCYLLNIIHIRFFILINLSIIIV